MLISIQFPIADSRSFLSNTGRLQKPGWPFPTPDEEFIRSYGPVRIRPQGGLAGWVGENEICEAAHAVRLARSLTITSQSLGVTLPFRVAYRRFFFDGSAVGKFELGLSIRSRKFLKISKQELKRVIERFLRLHVRIPLSNGNFAESSLIRSGKHIAQSYLAATTRNDYFNKPESWVVRAGTPLLFLECNKREQIDLLPYFTRKIDLPDVYNFHIHHCLVPFRSGTIRMWLLDKYKYNQGDPYFYRYNRSYRQRVNSIKNAARRLRIYLQRLNTEHECLRLILRNIMAGNLTVSNRSAKSDNLQHYFNEATKRIGILETKSSRQFHDEICEIAQESMSILNPGQIDALNRVLATFDLRKNILRKVEKYTDNFRHVTIIGNIEENNMGDTFKNISHAIIANRDSVAEGVITLRESGNEQVADAISILNQLIADADEEVLKAKKKKECMDLLDSITEESNKQEPNKNILRALGNTLLSIVTSIEPLAKAAKGAFEVLKKTWL